AGPSALASAISVTEDHSYSFKVTDFGYADTNDATTDPLASITITSLPTTGTLKLSGSAVTAAHAVRAPTNPKPTVVANTHVTTPGAFQLHVTVPLTTPTSASAPTTSTNVSRAAGPSALASAITVAENGSYTFSTSDFGYADAADATADPLASITITSLPTAG